MPSTSVHIPEELLTRLDRTAKRRRVSRNRLIVDACRSLVGEGHAEWPEDFFATEHLSARDVKLLRASYDDWSRRIRSARHSKKAPPF
jgi:hypothetical protein